MNELSPELLEVIRTEIAFAVKTTVNGKIDKIQVDINSNSAKHEEDMKRIMPIIETFEEGQRDLASAKKGGKAVLWLAGTITAVGGAWLVIRAILFNH